MTEFKGDKRTKQYKQWKKNHEAASNGLGDTVEKLTKATGIKKVVKFVAGEDCGCDQRKEKLNKLFRYKKTNCLTESEFELIKMAIDTNKRTFTSEDQEIYKRIYERIFNARIECTSCSFVKVIWNDLARVYKTYL